MVQSALQAGESRSELEEELRADKSRTQELSQLKVISWQP